MPVACLVVSQGVNSREWERRSSRSSRKRSGGAATSRNTVCCRVAPTCVRIVRAMKGNNERADRTLLN